MKFVWKGWQDPYDSLSIPTLLDGETVVWQGGYYYSGEVKEKMAKLKAELEAVCAKHGIVKDWSGDIWKHFEDQRTWSNG